MQEDQIGPIHVLQLDNICNNDMVVLDWLLSLLWKCRICGRLTEQDQKESYCDDVGNMDEYVGCKVEHEEVVFKFT